MKADVSAKRTTSFASTEMQILGEQTNLLQ